MFKSIICIVPHNQGEFINEAALQAGASGGSIIMGRGTASNSVPLSVTDHCLINR